MGIINWWRELQCTIFIFILFHRIELEGRRWRKREGERKEILTTNGFVRLGRNVIRRWLRAKWEEIKAVVASTLCKVAKYRERMTVDFHFFNSPFFLWSYSRTVDRYLMKFLKLFFCCHFRFILVCKIYFVPHCA